MRWGPGPVFAYESIAGARRWQHFALRALFVLALLVGLTLVWLLLIDEGVTTRKILNFRELAAIGRYFYYAIATIQITVVLLAAPAATAGAVCLDRARGTLTHLLVTDLSDSEIVLGKLGAKLAPVVALVAAAVPVLAIAGLLGGIEIGALASLAVVTLAIAVFGCAFALAVSVRSTRSHEVLTVVFAVWTFWILGPVFMELLSGTAGFRGVPNWYLKINPYVLAWSPYLWPGYISETDIAVFLSGTLGGSVLLIIYSIVRLRSYVKEESAKRSASISDAIGRLATRLGLIGFGTSLDDNPVLWREWHRTRPSRLTRAVWGLFIAFSVAGVGWGIYLVYASGEEQFLLIANALHVMLGLVLVSLAAPTALAEERTRGSLDVLLATPLSTASIVLGKWWGAYRVVPRLAILPLTTMIVIAANAPVVLKNRVGTLGHVTLLDRVATVVLPVSWVLVQGAVVTSFGLLLATWIPRIGRAVALSVSVHVLFSFGWPMLLELGVFEAVINLLFESITALGVDDEKIDLFLVVGMFPFCPLGGQYVSGGKLSREMGIDNMELWLIQLAGITVTLALAAGLLGLTLLTFERCLGRVVERPRTAPRPPRRVNRQARAAAALTESLG